MSEYTMAKEITVAALVSIMLLAIVVYGYFSRSKK